MYFRGKMLLVTVLDLTKCLDQIKNQRFLLTCALISELPSDISTMITAKMGSLLTIKEIFSEKGDFL